MIKPDWTTLRDLGFFQDIEEAALREIAQITSLQTVERDEMIVRQNDPGDCMYIIASGRVKVVLFGDDGKEVHLATLRQGDFFGEMSLLDANPRSATVIATETVDLIILKRESLLESLRSIPEIALHILSEMSRRLRIADQNIQSLALLDVYGRVARSILILIRQDGIQAGSNVIIEQRPTHQELAAMASASRETVSRIMADLVRAGLITIDGHRLIVHDAFLDREDFPDFVDGM